MVAKTLNQTSQTGEHKLEKKKKKAKQKQAMMVIMAQCKFFLVVMFGMEKYMIFNDNTVELQTTHIIKCVSLCY